MSDEFELRYMPDDHIDELCHELIKRVFDVEGCLLTDESSLYDFDGYHGDDDYPGHTLIPLTEVPVEDRALYNMPAIAARNLDRYYVYYPPTTEAEEAAARQKARARLLNQVAAVFGPGVFDYPNDDLRIWKVVAFLKERGLLAPDANTT